MGLKEGEINPKSQKKKKGKGRVTNHIHLQSAHTELVTSSLTPPAEVNALKCPRAIATVSQRSTRSEALSFFALLCAYKVHTHVVCVSLIIHMLTSLDQNKHKWKTCRDVTSFFCF